VFESLKTLHNSEEKKKKLARWSPSVLMDESRSQRNGPQGPATVSTTALKGDMRPRDSLSKAQSGKYANQPLKTEKISDGRENPGAVSLQTIFR